MSDAGKEAAPFEDAHDRRLEIGKVERTAALALMLGFANEKLAPGRIDEVDAAADKQHVLLLGMAGAHGIELLVYVIDRAEEERPVDAEQRELRTFRSVRFRHRFEAPQRCRRIGRDRLDRGVRRAIEVHEERAEHAHQDRELELQQQRR